MTTDAKRLSSESKHDIPITPRQVSGDKDQEIVVEDIQANLAEPIDPTGIPIAQEETKDVARAIRRVDRLLVPPLILIIAFCLIDRANMGLAAVAGMLKELELTGNRYSITLMLFFPGYVIFAIPSNYFLAKTSVRLWLSAISIGFGVFTLGMGFVQHWSALAVLRFFLGVFEAGIFPGTVVVLSSWYPRYYLQKRIALVLCGSTLGSSLAGVLAYVFSRIHTPGYDGWRWIFILEGVITVLIVIGLFFFIDEYPHKSHFLTQDQRKTIMGLLARDRDTSDEEEKLYAKDYIRELKDWKVWAFGSLYLFNTLTTYAMQYFSPIILHEGLGFSGAVSLLLSTPPSFLAFCLAMGLSYVSDRIRLRSPFIIYLCVQIIVGLTLIRWGPNVGSRYLGIFFAVSGTAANGSFTIGFAQNNMATRTGRSVVSGLQTSLGAVGGIIGTNVFRSQDAPDYTPGLITAMCSLLYVLVATVLLTWHLDRRNKQAESSGHVIRGGPKFKYTL